MPRVQVEKLFDMVVHSHFHPNDPYKMTDKITLTPKDQIFVISKSIQAFMHTYGVRSKPGDETSRIIQAFSGSSDLPELTKDVFNVTNAVNNYDILWQDSFKGIPLKRGELSWEVATVASGITFELVPEAGKAKFFGVSGSKVIVDIDKYGAGLGFTWEMMEGRKLYKFVDQLEQVRAALHTIWGSVHYGLLVAGATTTVAWQGVATDPTLDRDIQTLNKGYTTIGNATKDKGYGDTANVPMILYISPLYKSRINMALRATSSDIVSGRAAGSAGSTAGQVLEFPIEVRYTYNSAITANKGVLVLPRNKIQNSVYMREFSLSEKNIETLNEFKSYWTAFGAAIGDTDQLALLSFT